MATTLPKDLLYSAYRFSGKHLAPDASSKPVHGTCFHVSAKDKMYIVTNRHNVFLDFAHSKYIGYKIDGLVVTGYFGQGQFAQCDFAGQTISYAVPDNAAEDVVVMDVTGIPFRFIRKRLPGEDPTVETTSLAPIAVGLDMLAKENDFTKINPADRIAFPSYPSVYDRNGHRPLMRTGAIAGDALSDYQGPDQGIGRRVVYESYSTSGSSGGPVFCTLQTSELVVIGINSGHLTVNEPKIGTIHAGLSYCFKSTCIIESIEKLESKRVAAG